MVRKSKIKDSLKDKDHRDLPATVGLVLEVRDELRADIESVKEKVESLRHEIKGDIESVKSAIHRTQVLMEEQRNENKIVLDGIKMVLDRQDRMEARLPAY